MRGASGVLTKCVAEVRRLNRDVRRLLKLVASHSQGIRNHERRLRRVESGGRSGGRVNEPPRATAHDRTRDL